MALHFMTLDCLIDKKRADGSTIEPRIRIYHFGEESVRYKGFGA
jgi:hypothetical protein